VNNAANRMPTSKSLGSEYEKPGKRPLTLCAHCFGEFAALRALSATGLSLDQPVTLTVTVAPGRRED
jgi:hypothetical protein